jgi:16S rRNA C967 or C1407 C5-methylase (RsmB/RsmF family)/NOL1/NOP2/fmu family ribosome biogenesis protein
MTQVPSEFLEIMHAALPENEVKAFIDSLSQAFPVSIRKHKHRDLFLDHTEAIAWCPLGFYLAERPQFIFDPDFHTGTYYVQEASSMILWHILSQIVLAGDQPKILDLCAAPGGKSTLIANFLDGQGLLVSNEVIKSRAYTLKYNLAKDAYPNTIVTHADPNDFARLTGLFDVIVVDAPCSGEGMFRKDPASISEWSVQHVEHCSSRQKRIIADILPALKPGGHIVYSTCTYNPTENIDNIEWYCQEFDLTSVEMDVEPLWGIKSIHKGKSHGYQCYPHLVKGEGFFFSVLRKDNGEPFSLPKKTQASLIDPSKKQNDQIHLWATYDDDLQVIIDKIGQAHMIPTIHRETMNFISSQLRVIAAGLTIGAFNKDLLLPDHEFAFSSMVNQDITKTELSLKDALLFLKKELNEIHSDKSSWHLVTYHGRGLGWLKNLGNRINNYLPNEHRILKPLPPNIM